MSSQALLFNAIEPNRLPAVAVAPNGGNGGHPIGVPITDPGVDLASKTVCIKVRLSTMGNTRKVSTSQIEADADKDLLRVSKFRRVICDCLLLTWK